MTVVLDSNIFISALLKDSYTRRIIVSSDETFLFPEAIFSEIEEHHEELLKKSGLMGSEYEKLIKTLLKYVMIVPDEKTLPCRSEAFLLIGKTDIDDVPIMATALAYKDAAIWTNDQHFLKQKKVLIVKTRDMAEKWLK